MQRSDQEGLLSRQSSCGDRALLEMVSSLATQTTSPKGELEKGLCTSAKWSIDDNAMGYQNYVSVMATCLEILIEGYFFTHQFDKIVYVHDLYVPISVLIFYFKIVDKTKLY